MTLKANRFWGGVKIPFLPATRAPSTLRVTVSYVNPGPEALRMPKLYWRTDKTDKNLITPGIEFNLAVPLDSNFLEFFVEYSTDNRTEYTINDYSGGITVSVIADEFDPVFPTMGTRTYTFSASRIDPRPYIYPAYMTSQTLAFGDGTYRSHSARFTFQNGPLRKAARVRILDTNGNPLSAGLSQAALEAKTDWGSDAIAGWPAYTGTANTLGDAALYGNPNNMMIDNASASITIESSDSFILGAGATGFRIHRLYLANTVSNALAAAQASNPNITTLCDSLVLDVEDAGKTGPSFIGNDNRLVPQTRLNVVVYP